MGRMGVYELDSGFQGRDGFDGDDEGEVFGCVGVWSDLLDMRFEIWKLRRERPENA